MTDPLLDALDRRFGSSGPVRVYDPKRTKIREAPQPPREFVLPFRSPPALETKFIGHVPKRDKKPRANAGGDPACPHTEFWKDGRVGAKQRFKCKACSAVWTKGE